MSQLYKIGLQNFRVFKEMTEFDLVPLTILTGANSSGKSSLFKALLLMGNNVESNSFYKLDFTGTQHNLGSFQDAINKKCDTEKIIFRFYLNYPFQSIRKYPMPSGRKLTNVYLSSDVETETKLILEASYKQDNNNGLLVGLSIRVQDRKGETTLLVAEINENSSKKEAHKLSINLEWFANNLNLIQGYRRLHRMQNIETTSSNNELISYKIPKSLNIRNEEKRVSNFAKELNDDVSYIFEYFFRNQNDFISKEEMKEIGFDFEKMSSPPGRELWEIERFIRGYFLREAGYHFENIEYVEAVRAKSRRIYTHDSQTTLFDELLLDYNSVQLNYQAENFLKKWIKEFEIADDVQFEKIAGGIATQVIFTKNGDKYPLADLGYGVTQYLPLLLKIALQVTSKSPDRSKRESSFRESPLKKTIIIEEPETNLHPKLQSRLADMILDALQNFEIKFIVETHSEYFIRRLQILTAEKKVTSEKIALYYFYEPHKIPQGQKQVEKINILPDGNLDNDFGGGFFDEATNMKFELLKLKTKKK
jgi:predicted ATPase